MGVESYLDKIEMDVVELDLPEFLLGKAVADWRLAKHSLVKVRGWKSEANWSLVHAFYANIGGFVIRSGKHRKDKQGQKLIYTTAANILRLVEAGIIPHLPEITKDQINDKSKGDFIAKAKAVAQVTWIVIQVAVRSIKGLPINQIEILACSIAGCSLVTYVFCWYKPQNPRSCSLVLVEDSKLAEVEDICGRSCTNLMSELINRYYWDSTPLNDQAIRNSSILADPETIEEIGHQKIGLLLGGVLLGAVQCSAWNSYFPTEIERRAWRYLSIAVAGLVPIYYAIQAMAKALHPPRDREFTRRQQLLVMALWVVGVLYVASRAFILFEAVYSLFHLPPEAFVTTWSTNLPHFN